MISFELAAIFKQLQFTESRMAALHSLSGYVGSDDAHLFGKDPELGIFLPAPGTLQTLPNGARWRRFLNECAHPAGFAGYVPGPDGEDVPALGLPDESGRAVMVFRGVNEIGKDKLHSILALLPLLSAKLGDERLALISEGRAQAARDASRRTGELNAALDANRRELQEAWERAEKELQFRREAERKLQDADRRKDEFLAMLAHELRNPLAPISAAAELMEIVVLTEEKLKQTSQVISRQVRHMTALIDDLLDVSRVTRGLVSLEKTPQDLKTLIPMAIEQVRPLIEGKYHHLSVGLAPESAIVLGDAKRLVQITANLLNNAAKYTPEGGRIHLGMHVDDTNVVLSVQDNGIGISPEMQSQVFELFTQAERTPDRAQGGLGLGLALVKSMVSLHGGDVACESEGVGKGSTFIVTLPRLDSLDEILRDRVSNQDTGKAQRTLRILVVDDNEDAAQMLALFLEACGHHVLVERKADNVIKHMNDFRPDACILDIGMPDMDGNELARRLRARPETEKSVLIALTGYGQEQDRINSMAAGFNHHLTKPVDTKMLASILTGLSNS